MPVDPTHPGTEIKVTPDREAPIIPMETMYQGDFLFPLKKASLSAFRPVIQEIKINTEKYPIIIEAINAGLISINFCDSKIMEKVKDIREK